MGAILFAMGCMGRKHRRDGVLNVARKVPLVLLKDGKGGQEGFIWDWEGEKGKGHHHVDVAFFAKDGLEASHIDLWRSCSLDLILHPLLCSACM